MPNKKRFGIPIRTKDKTVSSWQPCYQLYKRKARKRLFTPKSSRTFANYVHDLIELGYLKVKRVKVRGNVRSFRVTL